jgi:hypothetical protein
MPHLNQRLRFRVFPNEHLDKFVRLFWLKIASLFGRVLRPAGLYTERLGLMKDKKFQSHLVVTRQIDELVTAVSFESDACMMAVRPFPHNLYLF